MANSSCSAMYVTFFLFAFFAIDPLAVGAAGGGGAVRVRRGGLSVIVRFAMRAKANIGMVQIFTTFGLAILMRGLAQFFFTPDYRSIPTLVARRQDRLARRHLPAGAATGRRAGLDRGVRRAVLLHQADRFRPRAGSDPRGCRRGGAGRHRQEQGVRAGLGPWRGAGRARRRRSWRCSSTSIPMSARRSR